DCQGLVASETGGMDMFTCSVRVVSTAIALAPLSAGGVLTVGPAGSGAQFTEIQAAVDAALANDVILVQPGNYQRVVVEKPVRILGDGTGVVRITGSPTSVTVRNIAAGAELVLSGMELAPTGFSGSELLLVQSCPGTVLLQDLNVAGEDFDLPGAR